MSIRIIAASDFHYPRRVRRLDVVREMAACDADVLVLGGDMVDTFDPVRLYELLEAASSFPGLKLYVWGNHELWSKATPARKLHEEAIPALARAHGFVVPEFDGPVLVGNVAFVGAMGWYDYSFAIREGGPDAEVVVSEVQDGKLVLRRSSRKLRELTPQDYARKSVAWYDQGRVRSATWNDGRLARWEMEDAELLAEATDRLAGHLTAADAMAEHIVAITHMVPHVDGVHANDGTWRAWTRAYMGSGTIGALYDAEPKVRTAIFGHCHHGQSFQRETWRGHNVASPSGRYTVIEVGGE